ncbi:OmpA family protein [Halovulum dunhuangense]|uniref:OmpA family protein n=1 Tax=Halovulum dunhuangense TaxID=1505036 RepID=A0A849L050_9RHOB|nr:OmpA family protein [Halovulum dunhuangense]NNU79180.1 OmpA family protein [Halovulum dunhuangense]
MNRAAIACIVAALLFVPPATAQETPLALPEGTVETARLVEDPGSVRLPTGRHGADDTPGITLEGRVLIRTWRIPAGSGEPLSVLRGLRPQLESAGYRPVFECESEGCGGFDFRFANRVLPAPAMEFDLTDFRALTARRDGAHIGLILSRSPRGGFVQAIEVTEAAEALPVLRVPEASGLTGAANPSSTDDLGARLRQEGRAVLERVAFAPGARRLEAEAIAALEPLAALLRADPALSVILVGHTDNEGGLAANIEVSRIRAEAVRRALIESHGIPAERLSAEGAGFLAPRASNTTPEGRALNRRVEVIPR